MDIFEFFWTPEILHSLSENTNAYYAVQRKSRACRKWKPTTAQEIGVFLGLLIAMGVNRCKSPNDLWRKTSGIRIYVPVWKRPVSKAMGNNRFFQIKRYFHVSPPSSVIGPDNWWEKLEPLSSKMRESCKRYYLPSTSVTVDEMMIRFGGRSKHTVRMPNKPITEGYKVFAICDHGYTINWRFHSRVKGIGELSSAYRDSVGISAPTTAVVYQLAESSLPYREYDFVIYMDNLFSTVALFSKLRSIGIGACGTARLQAGRFPLEYNNNAKDIPWNTVVGGAVSDSNGLASVLAMQWQDNNHVHALSTIHTLDEKVTRSRKRPRLTSTSGPLIRQAFRDNHKMNIPIPALIDDYNYHKGGVDIADQLRSYFFTQLIARRNWLPYFFWLLDTMVVNVFLLYSLNQAVPRPKITHKDFRLLLAGQLLQKYGPEEIKTRRWYKRKTARVTYSKIYGVLDLPPPVDRPLQEHVQVGNTSNIFLIATTTRHLTVFLAY